MIRAVLRLVEPLSNALEFPEGKSEPAGLREIHNVNVIHSHLQLFLSWPDYSSSFIKVAGEMVKVSITVDQGLGEFDQLFISTDETAFHQIKKNQKYLEKAFIEVFGITFGFSPEIQEFIEEFVEGMPCISILIPSSITRYNMRGTKRIRLDEPKKISIKVDQKEHDAILIDVSPSAFCFKFINENVILSDRVTVSVDGKQFDAFTMQSLNKILILKPITEEPEHFGVYFDLYVQYAYPMLRSRYSFPEDPIPALMQKTGQAKKHAMKEVSLSWLNEIESAYISSKDVKDDYAANYVAIDSFGIPVGTSSLAKVYIDHDSSPIWAFHGVGVLQDPKLLEHTCALYKWRVDYVTAKDPNAKVVVWFDGRGRWLEKVYTKYNKLTSDMTRLTAIKHNRYSRKEQSQVKSDIITSKWNAEKNISIKTFSRYMAADKTTSLGLGVQYLNYSGILNNVFFKLEISSINDVIECLESMVETQRPNLFFIEMPLNCSDLNFKDYELNFIDATNRQCNTTGLALRFFSSSLEHSQAVVNKKYGN